MCGIKNIYNILLKQDKGILIPNSAINFVPRSPFIGLKPNIKDHTGYEPVKLLSGGGPHNGLLLSKCNDCALYAQFSRHLDLNPKGFHFNGKSKFDLSHDNYISLEDLNLEYIKFIYVSFNMLNINVLSNHISFTDADYERLSMEKQIRVFKFLSENSDKQINVNFINKDGIGVSTPLLIKNVYHPDNLNLCNSREDFEIDNLHDCLSNFKAPLVETPKLTQITSQAFTYTDTTTLDLMLPEFPPLDE